VPNRSSRGALRVPDKKFSRRKKYADNLTVILNLDL